jgi:hypothetical protein
MRGIGKTTGLKIFNATSKSAFPNLIEIYLTMKHITQPGHPMQQISIMNVVAKELERISIWILPQDETSNIRGENVITALTIDEFVLLRTGAISFRGDRFISQRIDSPTPVDLDDLATLLNLPFEE